MGTNHGYVRKLSGEERKYLWNPLSNVTVVTRIEGPMSEDRLRQAIDKAKERHALLSSRVVYEKDGRGWFSHDGVPPIPLRIVERKSERQWQQEMMYEHRIPFKIFEGPLVRFVLLRSSRVSDLMVFCQHAICDGRGLVFLIRDILTCIAEPDSASDPLPLPPVLSSEGIGSYIPSKKSLKQTMTKWIVKKLNSDWKKDEAHFDQEDFENIHQAYWQRHEYRVESIELSEKQSDQLVAKCREHHITVNSALGAAFLAAHHELHGPFTKGKRNAALPVDLRNRLDMPAGDVLCFYISRVVFHYEHNPEEGFWQNAARFHDIANKTVETTNLFAPFVAVEGLEPRLLDAMSSFGTLAETVPEGSSRYEKLSAFAAKEKNPAIKLSKRFLRMSPGLILTNLGKPDMPDTYGDIKVQKMFFAPSTDKRFPLVIGAVTVGGRLIATINYVDEDRQASLSDAMKKIADKALGYLTR